MTRIIVLALLLAPTLAAADTCATIDLRGWSADQINRICAVAYYAICDPNEDGTACNGYDTPCTSRDLRGLEYTMCFGEIPVDPDTLIDGPALLAQLVVLDAERAAYDAAQAALQAEYAAEAAANAVCSEISLAAVDERIDLIFASVSDLEQMKSTTAAVFKTLARCVVLNRRERE